MEGLGQRCEGGKEGRKGGKSMKAGRNIVGM